MQRKISNQFFSEFAQQCENRGLEWTCSENPQSNHFLFYSKTRNVVVYLSLKDYFPKTLKQFSSIIAHYAQTDQPINLSSFTISRRVAIYSATQHFFLPASFFEKNSFFNYFYGSYIHDISRISLFTREISNFAKTNPNWTFISDFLDAHPRNVFVEAGSIRKDVQNPYSLVLSFAFAVSLANPQNKRAFQTIDRLACHRVSSFSNEDALISSPAIPNHLANCENFATSPLLFVAPIKNIQSIIDSLSTSVVSRFNPDAPTSFEIDAEIKRRTAIINSILPRPDSDPDIRRIYANVSYENGKIIHSIEGEFHSSLIESFIYSFNKKISQSPK